MIDTEIEEMKGRCKIIETAIIITIKIDQAIITMITIVKETIIIEVWIQGKEGAVTITIGTRIIKAGCMIEAIISSKIRATLMNTKMITGTITNPEIIQGISITQNNKAEKLKSIMVQLTLIK